MGKPSWRSRILRLPNVSHPAKWVGQAIVEYIVILSIVVLATSGALIAFKDEVVNLWEKAESTLTELVDEEGRPDGEGGSGGSTGGGGTSGGDSGSSGETPDNPDDGYAIGATLIGDVNVGETVAATASGYPSAGTNTFTYEWYVGDNVVSSATEATWTLPSYAYNQKVHCVITCENDTYGEASASTASVTVGQGVLSGTVTISDDAPQYGDTLTTSLTNLTQDANPSYQWYRDTVAIDGATESSYTVTGADMGAILSVVVKDGSGVFAGSFEDKTITEVAKADFSGLTVKVNGKTAPEQTLTAIAENLPTEGNNQISYQWLYSTALNGAAVALSGATSDSLMIPVEYAGYYLRCTVSVENPYYNVRDVTSSAAGPVEQGLWDRMSAEVTGEVKATRTVSVAVINEPNLGTNNITYQWYADGEAIDGATFAELTIPTSATGKALSVRVSCTNPYYAVEDIVVDCGTVASHLLSGGVSIDNTKPAYGDVLTATESGTPSDAQIAYQWYADGEAIDGANSAVYTVTAAEIGKVITVGISDASARYEGEIKSAATDAVAKASYDGLSAQITGEPKVGATITTEVTNAPADGTTSYSYQWYAGGSAIDGATSANYKIPASLYGKSVYCVVNAANENYAFDPVTTAPVAVGSEVICGTVALDNMNPAYGDTVTATVSNLPEGISVAYQWYRGDEVISGANITSYLVTVDDIGSSLKFVVTDTAGAYTGSLVGGPTAAVTKAAWSGQSVAVSGNAKVGGTLSASIDGLPTEGTNTVTYQWYADGVAIEGATSNSLSIGVDYFGKEITCEVACVNPFYEVSSVTSSGVTIGQGSLSGTVTLDNTAPIWGDAVTASVTGLSSGASAAYQWYADGEAIDGATSSSYVFTEDEIGKKISCTVTDSAGVYTGSVSSEKTDAVAKKTYSSVVATINGTVAVGETVSVEVSGLPAEGTNTVTYQWYLDGVAVSGATGEDYEIAYSDFGKVLHCVVSCENTLYTVTDVVSDKQAVDQGTFAGSVSISGDAMVGETLTASVSGMPEGAQAGCQWQADGVDIAGATGSTYTVSDSDLGKTIGVVVTDATGVYAGSISAVMADKVVEPPAYAAVYGGNTLVFGRAKSAPSTYNSLALTTGYDSVGNYDIENLELNQATDVPWEGYSDQVTSVVVKDTIKPTNMGWWFFYMENCTLMDVAKIDGSEVSNLTRTFARLHSLETLVLPDGFGKNAASLQNTFEYGKKLTTLTLPDGFGQNATDIFGTFSSCEVLTELDLPAGFGKNAETAYATFNLCKKLESITIPAGFAENASTMEGLFSGCWAIQEINLPAGFGKNTENIDGMFWRCETLPELTLPAGFGQSATDMGSIFGNMHGITELTLPAGFGAAKPTDMHLMFSDSENIGKLDLSMIDTSAATDMSNMLYGCTALTEVNVSGWNTSNVTDMSGMFNKCSSLTKLDLSSFDMSNVSDMSYIFFKCSVLEEIAFGEKWVWTGDDTGYLPDNSATVMGADGKWYDMTTLVGYEPSTVPDGVGMYTAVAPIPAYAAVYGGNTLVFGRGATAPTTYNSLALTAAYDDANGYDIEAAVYETRSDVPWFNSYGASIKKVAVIDEIAPVSGRYLFSKLEACTSYDIEKLNTSRMTTMYDMFYGNTSLTQLDLSHFDTSACTDMSFMFQKSSALTTIGDISGWDTSEVMSMNAMFYNNNALTSVDVSNFNTSKCENMKGMFGGCQLLKTIDVSNFDTSKVENMYGMFTGCYALTTLDCSGWVTSKVSDMGGVFYGAHSLTTVGDLSGWDTAAATTMYGMFYNCKALTVDCTGWDVGLVTNYSSFNYNAPGVTPPVSAWDCA